MTTYAHIKYIFNVLSYKLSIVAKIHLKIPVWTGYR